MDLKKACEEAVRKSNAKVIYGSAIVFTGTANLEKLRRLNATMSAEMNVKFKQRQIREIDAWKRWRREGPWHF
jgi:hypothetical protein